LTLAEPVPFVTVTAIPPSGVITLQHPP